MKFDYQRFLIAQARSGKTLSELGINPSTLYALRRGNDARPTTINKIAKALGVDPIQIIKKDGEE